MKRTAGSALSTTSLPLHPLLAVHPSVVGRPPPISQRSYFGVPDVAHLANRRQTTRCEPYHSRSPVEATAGSVDGFPLLRSRGIAFRSTHRTHRAPGSP